MQLKESFQYIIMIILSLNKYTEMKLDLQYFDVN